MNLDITMVQRLIRKDWDLHQKKIATYVGGIIFSLAVLGLPHLYAFYMGLILLLTIMVAAGFHLLSVTIIQEQKEQTIPFIMSLPVRPVEFALAKILFNLLVFLIPWLIMIAGLLFIILAGPIPNGLLPAFLLISLLLVVNYCIVLCVIMLTESEGWFLFSLVLCNIFINPFIMLLLRNPEFNQHFADNIFVWNNTATLITAAQLLAIVLLLWLVIFKKSRQLTFI